MINKRLFQILFCVIALFAVVSITVYVAYSIPYSFFFSWDTNKLERDEMERYSRATAIFEYLKVRPYLKNATATPRYCVSINTADRKTMDPQFDYFSQTLGMLLASMTLEDAAQVVLFVHNSGGVGKSNPRTQNVQDFVNVINRKGVRGEKDPDAMTMDYANALHACYNTSAKYSLILEDDAIATKDVFRKLNRIVTEADALDSQWGLIKLHLTAHYAGWQLQFLDILEMSAFGFAAGVVPALVASKVFRTRRKATIFVYITWALCGVMMVFIIGKQNVQPPEPGLSPVNLGCCSPAHVYRTEELGSLSQYLKEHAYEANGDELVADWCAKRGLTQYVYHPNLFQHVGRWSSKSSGNKGGTSKMHMSLTWEP